MTLIPLSRYHPQTADTLLWGYVMVRFLFAVLCGCALATPCYAQNVKLGEDLQPGEYHRYELELTVTGKLKVERNGKPDALPLKASASHRFVERIETADSRGGAGKVIRHYEIAKSNSVVSGEKSARELADDRRVTVAGRTESGTVHYSPLGPLFREELELIAEHFDTMVLAGLLPNKELKPGETWTLASEAVQHACQFEGITKNELVGTLVSVEAGIAKFTIAGLAEGVELGAATKTTVKANGSFDVKSSRISQLNWEQADDRGQGPASPAAELTATIALKRTVLAEEPKELSAAVREKVPAGKATPEQTILRYTDVDGKYSFTYPREWVIVGRTDQHLLIRLVEKSEFIAQVTLSSWKKAEPGQHATAEEFKQSFAKLPGWAPAETTEDGVVNAPVGHWLYKVAARGKQDGAEVHQTFYLFAGPNGDQVTVSVLASPEKGGKTSAREGQLLGAIVFPTPKK